MAADKKRSFLSGNPSWALALICLIVSIIYMPIMGVIMMIFNVPQGNIMGDVVIYIISDLFVATACYFIVKWNPKSIWYAPLICNLYGIVSFILVQDFRTGTLCILIVSGWILSIIASIIGARNGKTAQIKQQRLQNRQENNSFYSEK